MGDLQSEKWKGIWQEMRASVWGDTSKTGLLISTLRETADQIETWKVACVLEIKEQQEEGVVKVVGGGEGGRVQRGHVLDEKARHRPLWPFSGMDGEQSVWVILPVPPSFSRRAEPVKDLLQLELGLEVDLGLKLGLELELGLEQELGIELN